MIAHTSVAVKDFVKSKELYIKMLAPLAYAIKMDLPDHKAAGFAQDGKMDFWIGENKEYSAGVHVAFLAHSKEEVENFYKAALEAGAKDNGVPGYRKQYSPGYYGAFVYDFDGNNIEAVWFDPDIK
jgi:predicted lactoylglutathione lyase